jgi:hypothetical protein
MENPKGIKHDQGKPLAACLKDFSLALLKVAEVATFGANKYERGNWQDVENGETRYDDAKWRHMLASRHEEYDPETNLMHEAHEAWNTLAKLELKLRRLRRVYVNDSSNAVRPLPCEDNVGRGSSGAGGDSQKHAVRGGGGLRTGQDANRGGFEPKPVLYHQLSPGAPAERGRNFFHCNEEEGDNPTTPRCP